MQGLGLGRERHEMPVQRIQLLGLAVHLHPQPAGGFTDQVDNHLLQTFGSAILVALIGAGTEMMIPQDRNELGGANSAEDSARRSFAETFGQISEQTVSRNLNVQPTLEIRPGYQFNVLVDQDLVFPGAF